MTNANAIRRSLQRHISTPRLETPFHPRLSVLSTTSDWYNWAGYKAPHSIFDSELEYFAIRSTAALFDISPMVKYRIKGRDAESLLNRVTLRDVRKLIPGRVHYTAWCDDEGHVLDDGTLFRLSDQDFRLCCQERHLPWLADSAIGFNVEIAEETDEIAGLALQGPTSFAVLSEAGFAGVEHLRPFQLALFEHDGGAVVISRTGFTGDLGYELFVPAQSALSLWDRLWQAGQLLGVQAIGYDALNRARIEAGFIVANADFVTAEAALRADRERLPDEIGLDWMIDLEKPWFNGRDAILEARRKHSLRYILVGLEIESNIPAEHALVYHRKKKEAGLVTAAIWSPLAKRNIAIATLERPFGDRIVDDLWVEIYALRELQYHKMMKRAKIVPRPFVKLDRRSANPPGRF
ncbi:aminomethyltransferase family protein [Ciceribacter sp. L1K22]|uniref:aminomethyltransferase family protein n=1 Tax=Ciceribacter sp. L1K22 TaxID=2820275 RepID=UPI001ABE2D9C|nr:aminomethyltransferase family protein [Ciceribacter sp. L1K22]MBO3762241.1 aminomethyltransferase family protein [Ciceribacter sp. L1K22]